MPFCFECGEEVKGSGNKITCQSCGWSNNSIQQSDASVNPEVCPDCLRIGKKMRQCGVCREKWFCSWCFSERRNRSFAEIYSKMQDDDDDINYDEGAEHEAWGSYYSTLYDATMSGASYHRAESRASAALSRTNRAQIRSQVRAEKQKYRTEEKKYKTEIDRWEPCIDCAKEMFGCNDSLPGFNVSLMRNPPTKNKNISKEFEILEDNIGLEIEIEYTSETSGKSVRKVILTEVYKNKKFEYLKAFCILNGEERVFRIDRISRINL